MKMENQKAQYRIKMTLKMESQFIILHKPVRKKEKKVGKEMWKTDCGYGGMIKEEKLKRVASKLGKSMVCG